MPKLARISPLHRLLAVKPGLAPRWVLSGNCDTSFDLFTVFGIIWGAFVVFAVARFAWWAGAVAALPLVFFEVTLHVPFIDCESFARARRRRGECTGCSRSLSLADVVACPECGTTVC